MLANNELYSIKINNGKIHWTLVNSKGDIPLKRLLHSACEISKNRMLVFGGLYENSVWLNDIFILTVNN